MSDKTPVVVVNKPPLFELHQVSNDELQRIGEAVDKVPWQQSTCFALFVFALSCALYIFTCEFTSPWMHTGAVVVLCASLIGSIVTGILWRTHKRKSRSILSSIHKRKRNPEVVSNE